MIVLDASAAIDWLLRTPAGQLIDRRIYARQDTLHTVHLLDVEFAGVPRRPWTTFRPFASLVMPHFFCSDGFGCCGKT